jgi:hypothetical protein
VIPAFFGCAGRADLSRWRANHLFDEVAGSLPAGAEECVMPRSIDLDGRRGMAAQLATERRRLSRAIAVDQGEIRARREAMEKQLFAAPATEWPEAIDKMRYLLMLLGEISGDPRVHRMIQSVLADCERLAGDGPAGGDGRDSERRRREKD